MECIYRLLPTVNQYSWGKKGAESLVYRLFQNYFNLNAVNLRNLDHSGPFSELWLGTHHSSPSMGFVSKNEHNNFKSDDNYKEECISLNSNSNSEELVHLSKLLSKIYTDVQGLNAKDLKILFKVLSIDKPLSLQMHPDDESSLKLFNAMHKGIVDGSAKPEMCIALTKFRALCGFREYTEIKQFADKYPEFKEAVGDDCFVGFSDSNSKTFYIKLLTRFFKFPGLGEYVQKLADRLEDTNSLEFPEECFLILYNNYGTDPSVFFVFILNCLELVPGQALFLAPNTMHSYISGDCVEIMKNSDNVIRCGLTDKFKDVNLCLNLLENRFTSRKLEDFFVQPLELSGSILKYEPKDPSCNFVVWSMTLAPCKEEKLVIPNRPFFCIVLESNPYLTFKVINQPSKTTTDSELSTPTEKHVGVEMGDCFLLLPNTELTVINKHQSNQFIMYIASEKE